MESIVYGIVVSLVFIGFVSLVFILILHFSDFDSYGKYVIHITNEMSKEEIFNLINGINVRKTIYGNHIFNEVVLINSLSDREKISFLSDLCNDSVLFTTISYDEIQKIFSDKGV